MMIAAASSSRRKGCCPNFRCSAGFQPARRGGSRQDGGATLELGEPLEYRAPSQPARPFVRFYRVGIGTSYGMYFDVEIHG